MPVKSAKGAKGACDRMWAEIVKSPQRCERCGGPGPFQAAHIIPRRFAKTRTNEANGWCLCGSCHFMVDAFPDEKMNLVRSTIGTLVYAEMRSDAEDTRRKMDWEAERVRLKAVLETVREAA